MDKQNIADIIFNLMCGKKEVNLADLASDFADYFSVTEKGFDKDKFFKQCGLLPGRDPVLFLKEHGKW